MATGANILNKRSRRIWPQILKLMGWKAVGPALKAVKGGRLYTKAGVPATNTAADAPNQIGDMCLDTTNQDVYICSSYTSSSVFTWTKVTA